MFGACVRAAPFGIVWPSCANQQSTTTTTLLGTGDVGRFTATGPTNDTIFQSPASVPLLHVGACASAAPDGTAQLCITPGAAPASNAYGMATVHITGTAAQPAPAAGTLVTVSYNVRFVDGVDTYNEFGYGYQLITAFGQLDAAQMPAAAAFGLATGSLPVYFNYPDWDSDVPLGSVWPLTATAQCDSLVTFNENSSTPCKFYQRSDIGAPLRAEWFAVSVTFNVSESSYYLTRATVLVNGTGAPLFDVEAPPPRWSATPIVAGATPVLAFVSARSPAVIWNLYVSATLPNCATQRSTVVTTATTLPPSTGSGTAPHTGISLSPIGTRMRGSNASPSTTHAGTSGSRSDATSTGGSDVTSDSVVTATATGGERTSTNSSGSSDDNLLMSAQRSSSTGAVDDTPLFIALLVVFGSICCVVLLCTVLRKRIRRSTPVKAMYASMPPAARRVCCYPCRKLDYELGSSYEEGESLGECVRVCVRALGMMPGLSAATSGVAAANRSERRAVRRRGRRRRRRRQ